MHTLSTNVHRSQQQTHSKVLKTFLAPKWPAHQAVHSDKLGSTATSLGQGNERYGFSSVPHWSQHHAQSIWQGVEPPEEPIHMRRSQQQTQASRTRISLGQPPTVSVVDVA